MGGTSGIVGHIFCEDKSASAKPVGYRAAIARREPGSEVAITSLYASLEKGRPYI